MGLLLGTPRRCKICSSCIPLGSQRAGKKKNPVIVSRYVYRRVRRSYYVSTPCSVVGRSKTDTQPRQVWETLLFCSIVSKFFPGLCNVVYYSVWPAMFSWPSSIITWIDARTCYSCCCCFCRRDDLMKFIASAYNSNRRGKTLPATPNGCWVVLQCYIAGRKIV